MDRIYAEFVKLRPFRNYDGYITADCSYWRIYKDGVVVDRRLKKAGAYILVNKLRQENN